MGSTFDAPCDTEYDPEDAYRYNSECCAEVSSTLEVIFQYVQDEMTQTKTDIATVKRMVSRWVNRQLEENRNQINQLIQEADTWIISQLSDIRSHLRQVDIQLAQSNYRIEVNGAPQDIAAECVPEKTVEKELRSLIEIIRDQQETIDALQAAAGGIAGGSSTIGGPAQPQPCQPCAVQVVEIPGNPGLPTIQLQITINLNPTIQANVDVPPMPPCPEPPDVNIDLSGLSGGRGGSDTFGLGLGPGGGGGGDGGGGKDLPDFVAPDDDSKEEIVYIEEEDI